MTARSRRRLLVSLTTAATLSGLLVACGGDETPAAGGGDSATAGGDEGTTLTMWARNTSDNLAQEVVDAYNAGHDNQVDLTIIPNESYQTKVATAAASGGLPDILAYDVVYAPNYIEQGLLQEITDRVEGLDFYDDLSKAHVEAASGDGDLYGVPFIVDSSLVLYNKDLFEQAGLDPEDAPDSYEEILQDARAIRSEVGGDTYGFYFGGNCQGCNAYTMFGNLAAADQPPFTDGGETANFDTPAMRATLDLYRQMWEEDLVAPGAQSEDGSTWVTLFNEGKIGILPRGTGAFAGLEEATFDWDVVGMPAPEGGSTSGFVGGDVAGISSSSENVEQAWDFLEWSLSEDNQVEVIAANDSLPSRVDLADNEYSAQSPQQVKAIEGLADGYTPSTTGYANAVQNPNGPWLAMVRNYVFEGDQSALANGQQAIQDAVDAAQ